MNDLIDAPSPNHGPRRGAGGIDMLILHYTGMADGPSALARMRDPDAQVSAHYMIEEDGRIFRLVDEDRRAWHAGLSFWRGERDINSRSVGIELVNPGPAPYPEAQIVALEQLCRQILARHPAIVPANVLGHSDIAPTRKDDPGPLFPWPRLAAAGIGRWPFTGGEAGSGEAVPLLAAYGYDVADPAAALRAFQRHFRPEQVDGRADAQTLGRLRCLLDRA